MRWRKRGVKRQFQVFVQSPWKYDIINSTFWGTWVAQLEVSDSWFNSGPDLSVVRFSPGSALVLCVETAQGSLPPSPFAPHPHHPACMHSLRKKITHLTFFIYLISDDIKSLPLCFICVQCINVLINFLIIYSLEEFLTISL